MLFRIFWASALVIVLAQPLKAQPLTGYAARYRPGLMAKVASNRGMTASNCMVASPLYSLGTRLRVTGINTSEALICQVVDVAHPRDRSRILARGIIIELAHENTRSICGSTREPPRLCPVKVERKP